MKEISDLLKSKVNYLGELRLNESETQYLLTWLEAVEQTFEQNEKIVRGLTYLSEGLGGSK